MADTPTQLRAFVSHSGLDKAICDQVVGALRGAGADIWYDEHNLGAGQLLEEIQREVLERPVFIVLLSKNAFAAAWVKRETTWAFNLYNREPNRLILPITVGAIEANDFNTWLFLEDFKRVEGRGMQPLPKDEMIAQMMHLLALTPKGQTPVAVKPQTAEGLDDLIAQGKALASQSKYAEALPFFERATKIDPNSFDAWYNQAKALHDSGHQDKAIAAYRRALTLDPHNTFAWGNLGIAFEHFERWDDGIRAFDQALALNELAVWLEGKAYCLRRLGRTAEAEEAERRAKELGG